jgi:hypothetical protein
MHFTILQFILQFNKFIFSIVQFILQFNKFIFFNCTLIFTIVQLFLQLCNYFYNCAIIFTALKLFLQLILQLS